jgi:hypothetical protein
MMFECMFDRVSQHPPSDTVKKRERLFDTTGTHVASVAFRLAFLCIDPGLETPSRDHINVNATSWIDCPEDRP